MARGSVATVGDTRVSQNGYQYTKTEKGWRLSHHLLAEKMLGRELHEDEMVQFIGKKTDLRVENIRVIQKKTTSLRRRKAIIEQRIEELTAELNDINKRLESYNHGTRNS